MSSHSVARATALDDELIIFRRNVRSFAETYVRPLVSEMDECANIPRHVIDRLFELGLMAVEVPEHLGGAGAAFVHAIVAVEELSRVDPSVAVLADVQNTLVLNAILRWASEDLKRKYVPRLATTTVGAYALSEESSGSDAFALQTRAVESADGFILTGRKQWITNAHEAELFIVFANANPAAGHRGITGFLVERGLPGFAVGKKERKLGIRASSTCELTLDGCIVPRENVLGEVGGGYRVAMETLNEGRIGIGAQMVGLAQGALDVAVRYVKERRQFGRPVAEFQGVQFQIAQARTDLEAARLLVYNGARLKDEGRPFLLEAAMAKLCASQMAERVSSLAVQLLGGNGYVTDYPVEKFYRDAKIGQIYEGTSNMQLQTIAKQMLRD